MGMADEVPTHNTMAPPRVYAGPPGEPGNIKPALPWYVQQNMRLERRKQKGK